MTANGGAKKLSNVTVVEGLRAASTANILNGNGRSSSKQLPPDTRQRLEDLARGANTRPIIARSVSSAAVKTMAGSAPNLAATQPPKRGQTILEENAARLNNNGKTASVPSISQQQSLRRDRDLNLKNSSVSTGDVSVSPNLTLSEQQQQQHLPTSLSSDPSKKVRPRSFGANWWRF